MKHERLALIPTLDLGNHTMNTDLMNGVRSATTDAEIAILRYGTFDAYDLFMPLDHPTLLEKHRADLKAAGVDLSRVSTIPLPEIRRALATKRYFAAHDGNSPFLERLDAMIRPVVQEPTPCTCVHHSISYGCLIPNFISICATGLPAYDALICSSTDSRLAQQRILEHLCGLIKRPAGAWGHRLEHISLGVDVDSFVPTVSQAQARKLLKLPIDGQYLIYLGRLSTIDKADLALLLRIFSQLRQKGRPDELRLILAGDNTVNYAEQLREQSRELGVDAFVHIFTNVSQLTKRLILWAADIFVSPADSIQESFGLTVVEAMAAGLPAVVSDWDGYKDIVEEGISGFRIPTLWGPCSSHVEIQAEMYVFAADHFAMSQGVVIDEDLFVARLSQLLSSKEFRETMGTKAVQSAKRFDWKHIVSQYEELWKSLKEEALTTPKQSVPVRFPFWNVFGHYATRTISSSDIVSIRTSPTRIHPPSAQLQLVLPQFILQRLYWALSDGPKRVAELASDEMGLYGLLWLAKHGSVQITPAPSSLDTDSSPVAPILSARK